MIRELLYQFLYNTIAYPAFLAGGRIGSLFNKKLDKGFRIHAGSLKRWKEKAAVLDTKKPRIWFHVASTGEFEQAKPVIDLLRDTMKGTISIIITYYSPTVEKIILNYAAADIQEILPLDTSAQVNQVLHILHPSMIVFVKYDIWPNLLWQAKKRNITLALINGTLRKKSLRISNAIGKSFFKVVCGVFDYIGAVSDDDSSRFQTIVHDAGKIRTIGDSRFDRVKLRKDSAPDIQIPDSLRTMGRPVFICGSTWSSDEERIIPALSELLKKGLKFHTVIVPHEPTEKNISSLIGRLQKRSLSSAKYSGIRKGEPPKNITIVDGVGFLAELYTLGTFAYVGGGFLISGVHNCMEPAVRGLPLCFGPNYHNSPEAERLVAISSGHKIGTSQDLIHLLEKWISNSELCSVEGSKAKAYIESSLGAASAYVQDIIRLLKGSSINYPRGLELRSTPPHNPHLP